jgi:hypothetical protein
MDRTPTRKPKSQTPPPKPVSDQEAPPDHFPARRHPELKPGEVLMQDKERT